MRPHGIIPPYSGLITVFGTSFATSGATITMPASVQAGDRAYLIDTSANSPGPATTVTPAGWTGVNSVTGSDTLTRQNISFLDCAGSEGGSTITGMSSNAVNFKAIIVIRKTTTALHFGTTSSIAAAASLGSNNIATQATTSGSGRTPLIVIGFGVDTTTQPAATLSVTPTSTANNGPMTLAWLIYGGGPANITVSDPNGQTTCGAMSVFYVPLGP